MAKVESFQGTTRLAKSHEDIWPGSPLAVLGIMVDVLRARFSQDNVGMTPYVWDSDPTPEDTEDGTSNAPRKLIIESQYLQQPDARDASPAIYVERGDLVFEPKTLGSRGEHNQQTGQDFYFVHGTMPISMLCVSALRGESMDIGTFVAMYMLSMRTQLREIFGFQDVQPPVLGGTQVYRRSANDIESWITPVTFQVTAKYLWIETPIAPKLREIHARFTQSATNKVTAVATTLNADRKR